MAWTKSKVYSMLALLALAFVLLNLLALSRINSENDELPEDEQTNPGDTAGLCATSLFVSLIFFGLARRARTRERYRAYQQQQMAAWQQQTAQQQAWQQQQQQAWQQQQQVHQDRTALEQRVLEMQGLISHMQLQRESQHEQRKLETELAVLKEQLAGIKEQHEADREKPRINISVGRVGDDVISDSIVTNRPGDRVHRGGGGGGDAIRDSVVAEKLARVARDAAAPAPAARDAAGPPLADRPSVSKCPTCGRLVKREWAGCPYCSDRR